VLVSAKEKGIRCSVTTNGMTTHLLNNDELKKLKQCRTEINLSVDSFDADIHSFTRGKDNALENALLSLKKLNENSIPVTVLCVISKYNFQYLFKFFTTAFERGVKQVLFQPVIYFSNYPEIIPVENKSQLNVSYEKLDILMDELRKILDFEKRHKIKSNVYRIFPWIEYYIKTAQSSDRKWFFNEVLNRFFCREIYAIIDITYNGGIQPCGLASASVFIQDNRHRDLLDLWSEATLKIKEDMLNERYHPYCNGCCHHFSRNMLASIFKYPFKNRKALFEMLPFLLTRIRTKIIKKR
jgi:MoaA/NifB/PqqE/SkfB family radical SAM enzyme